MKNMCIIIVKIIILLLMCAFVGGLEIDIPNRIFRLTEWPNLVGMLLLIASLLFFDYNSRKHGYEEAIQEVKKVINSESSGKTD